MDTGNTKHSEKRTVHCLVLFSVLHVKAGEWDIDRAAGFLPVPIGDMILSGSFFGAAVLYRRRSEIHMRLMLFATVALLFAAIGRMTFLSSVPFALLLW